VAHLSQESTPVTTGLGTTPRPRRAFDERLVLAVLTVATALFLIGAFVWLSRGIRAWQTRDLDRHARLVAALLREDLIAGDQTELLPVFDRVAADERVHGLLLCEGTQTLVASHALAGWLDCADRPVRAAISAGGAIDALVASEELFVSPQELPRNRHLVVVQDRSFIARRGSTITELAVVFAILASILAAIVYWVISRAARSGAHRRLNELLRRAAREPATVLPDEISSLIRNLDESVANRRAAVVALDPVESGPARLRRLVAEKMPDTRLVLIANREPYIHARDGSRITVTRPASGLVTGVEPLLRACGGVWVGHGSGSADREVADAKGRLGVPPEDPEYVLRRVWLTRKEEEGYYYGFSNEGLWPLCHIAHARPLFRTSDWEAYQTVNRRFAAVAAEEAGEAGLILVQDYHFALVPAELRRLSPDSVISIFWHIPWPNEEVVGICPWTRELLDGMLGADVIGFHTRYHCLNFLETVNRFIEARVDLEMMSIEYGGHLTRVKPYPISVQWPYPAASAESARSLRTELGLDEKFVFLGVDRADYTKGLLERVWATDALLQEHPDLVGKVVYLQLAAPSRTHIKRYRDLISEVEEAVTAVNRKWRSDGWEPIRFELRAGHGDEVPRLYAMADCALVTPLHDGMNLVAKEYVASRADEDGTLVLSVFAGASKELEGALLVNPYDTAAVAAAMFRATTMEPAERRARMRSMRAAIERNSIYDWSASLLTDMAEIWKRKERRWPKTVVEESALGAEKVRLIG
jgi:trehalose 6-phosphate synthase